VGKRLLKRIDKSEGPNQLTVFNEDFPQSNWDDFRERDFGKSYADIKKNIFDGQSWICGYCEISIPKDNLTKQKIEHFHDKSDADEQHNWALDWDNIFGVCLGGSDKKSELYPLPYNLSCDSHKEYVKSQIGDDPSGVVLNPLSIPSNYSLFTFDKRTGHLEPDETACLACIITPNTHENTFELVSKTIEVFNLNCYRLIESRRAILLNYNQLFARYRKANDRDGARKLAERWFRDKTLSFHTTRRILLGSLAEAVINS
jgi:uncharacterized protein (TIGR02646 family)